MSRGKASGISLYKADVKIVLGMAARGDRNHDIAAWFGVNQGRIAEAKNGEYGPLEAAPAEELPPQGPPGVKGRRLRGQVQNVLDTFEQSENVEPDKLVEMLKTATEKYDSNEA